MFLISIQYDHKFSKNTYFLLIGLILLITKSSCESYHEAASRTEQTPPSSHQEAASRTEQNSS